MSEEACGSHTVDGQHVCHLLSNHSGFHSDDGALWLDECHGENPRYGPGNPDWEHDRHREDTAA